MSEPPAQTQNLGLSVATAAARSGLTPATLRTWDRRYGLSPSVRTAGGHRRYNSMDLHRLTIAARLVDDGLPPAGAAATAMGMSKREVEDWLTPPEQRPAAQAAAHPPATPGPAWRAGGGRSLPLTDATDEQRGLARAAMALDGEAIRAAISSALTSRGAVATWDELAAPVLVAVGDRWSRTQEGVEIEHITSRAIAAAFDINPPAEMKGRPVLLTCAPEEQHDLALLALSAALLERGTPTVMLGKRVPAEALKAAAARLRPRSIVMWAATPELANDQPLKQLPRQRPPTRLYVAGPGWNAEQLQPGIRLLSSISAAVAELAG